MHRFWHHRAPRFFSDSLLLAGALGMNSGCDDGECSKQGTWCDGDSVYECSEGEGTPVVPDGAHESKVDDCAGRGGVCRELRPTFARCVVPDQTCGADQNRVCWNGNAYSCRNGRLLLDPAEVCSEDAPCTPTPSGTGASCEPVDSGTGGAANAGGAGRRVNRARMGQLGEDYREEDVRI